MTSFWPRRTAVLRYTYLWPLATDTIQTIMTAIGGDDLLDKPVILRHSDTEATVQLIGLLRLGVDGVTGHTLLVQVTIESDDAAVSIDLQVVSAESVETADGPGIMPGQAGDILDGYIESLHDTDVTVRPLDMR